MFLAVDSGFSLFHVSAGVHPMPERDYDVVLYGASGFSGRQTVEYFSRHAPPGVRWAVAGRNREKLEAAKNEIRSAAQGAHLLSADSRDQVATDAIVSRTRVLFTTAGPFALYGTGI